MNFVAVIGEISVYLSFILVWITFINHWKRETVSMKSYKFSISSSTAITASLWLSMLLMVFSFIRQDYSLIIVFQNSDQQMNVFDRIMATWASRAGSMLLWAALQSTITLMVLLYLKDVQTSPFEKRIVTILLFFNGLISSFALSVKNPSAFETQSTSGISNGLGLTPSLLNFWQQIHPPVAFLAYSAFIVPYAVGVAGLTKKSEDLYSDRHRWLVDFFMLIGWLLTTVFIVAGSIWAYEVDWGGFWFFDAVQTSSIILWLMASLYFHFKPLINKEYPIHFFIATLGWLGVTIAALIVRGGFLEGPHTYSGVAQRIVFSLLLLGTLFGILYGVLKNKQEIFPEWLFSIEQSPKKKTLLTIWLISVAIIVNTVSIVLEILYTQLEIPLGDLTNYYRIINGIFLSALSILLIICENESSKTPIRQLGISFFLGIVITFIWSLLSFKELHIFSYFLLLLVGGAVISQLTLLLYSILSKQKIKRISIRLVHFTILLTLFSYFVTDPQTIETENTLHINDPVVIDKFDLRITLQEIATGNITNNVPTVVKINVMNNNISKTNQIILKQGIYLGQPWSKGDWIITPSYDIYMKIAEIDFFLFLQNITSVNVITKIIPGVNIFRFNIFLFSIVSLIAVYSNWKHRK